MDDIVRQRVNEILNEKIAMGAGEGGYGTKRGAKKAVATKRRIARARAPTKRAPIRRAPVKRKVGRCRAGEGYEGGAGRTTTTRRNATADYRAKCKIADLKEEVKELKAEVREEKKEVKALEKMIEAPMRRGVPKKRVPTSHTYLKERCAKSRYQSNACREMFPAMARQHPVSAKQMAARKNFAIMSKQISEMMAEHRMAGHPITRQEAACMVTGNRGKNCEQVELVWEGQPAMAPMEQAIHLVKPNEVMPQVEVVGQGGRYARRGRGNMGYGTLVY